MFIANSLLILVHCNESKAGIPRFTKPYMNVYQSVSSVAQLCPILCDPMNHSTPVLPVHHQLPELSKLMSVESVMPSNHAILCRLLLLLPSVFPCIRVFSNESVLCIRWPKYWSFRLNISPSKEHPGLISSRRNLLRLSRVFSKSTVLKYRFFSTQLSL